MVAFHAGLTVPGGFVGVDVFFVISGFVIGESLLRELSETGSLSLRRFYARRARRLLPALALMLAIVALASAFASPFGAQRMAAVTTGAAALFSANVYLAGLGTGYFDVATTLNPLLHTWSLAVEEQFYVLFPFALLLAWRLGGRRAAAGAIVGITALSFVLSLHLSTGDGTAGRFAFYSSPTRAWEFGIGALLAAAPLAWRLPAGAAAIAGLAGAASIDFAATSLHGTDGFPGTQALYPAVGACLLILGGGPITHFLSTRPLVAVGDLSYSWYLWHWPLIVFAGALLPGRTWAPALAAVLSMVPAYGSYRLLENPVRRRVLFGRVRPFALAGVCALVPLLAAACLALRHDELGHNPRFADLGRSQRLHADVMRGCDSPTPLGERVGSDCTWRVADPRGTVILVGDSNAGHFTEPVTRAANSLGYDATVATFSSCPFTVLRLRYDGGIHDSERCRSFVDGTLARLAAQRPNLVIVASRTDKYLREGFSLAAAGAPDNSFVHDEEAKAQRYEAGLARVLRTLNARRIPVLLVHPVPRLPFDPSRCSVETVLRGSCTGERRRAAVDAELITAVRAEDAAVAAVPRTRTLDLESRLCGQVVCRTSRNGVSMYRDEDHLSIDGALTLTHVFAAQITHTARSSTD